MSNPNTEELAVFFSLSIAFVAKFTGEKLLSVVSQTNEVSSLIEDPELSKEKIAKTIIDITEGEIGELAKKLLELLAENKRLNF
mgnify:CR=1 FL=1